MTLRRYAPSALLLVLLLLRWLLPAAAIEAVYSRGFFVAFRSVWDYTLPLLPIPLFYVFWLAVILFLALSLVRWKKARKAGRPAWKPLGVRLWNAVALLICVFLLAWGFNYGRLPAEEQIGFERYQPTLEELRTRVHTEAAELAQLRSRISSDTSALEATTLPTDLESRVRALMQDAFTQHGYPAPGKPRARQLKPQGILLRWSTAGVYWPWAGEANIDAGLYHLQKPAVMAHEFAHAYGIGGEGACTFWAWLGGKEAQDPYLAYAFKLAYWRQIAGRLRQAEPDAYTTWRAKNLDPGIRNDLAAIYANGAKYQDIAPVVRDLTYDAYLRTQGVHGGIANYGTVVQMVEGYRRKE
ncbi:DUF3810 family protein [Lewinella sp. 4G2]|uniref:DUF3810 family protein n=1 Tax=Lewinella sp. 4G2 TaxID=1803372 RepID=UPI0007B4ACA6|nr:DUF3810 family protein [Lewinella sp. 4G2]OAV46122.1 hypothetical protein A3850_017840 [Lewinella sp. 4G2]